MEPLPDEVLEKVIADSEIDHDVELVTDRTPRPTQRDPKQYARFEQDLRRLFEQVYR